MKVIILMTLLISNSIAKEDLGWKQIGSEDDIHIYAKTSEEGIIPFKAVGHIQQNINAVLDILKDHEQKPSWAPKLEKVTLHKQLKENQFIFSEYYKTPWPASDREFLLQGEIVKQSDETIILKAHSVESDQKYKHLISEDHVQADVQYINVKLVKIDDYKTQIEFEFEGDMKGWMPIWLTNLIQKKWPLRFIQGLRNQTQKKKHIISYNSP